jgi:hypothetical protein
MSLEDSMTVMFMVPKKFNKETLPAKRIADRISTRTSKTVAAITLAVGLMTKIEKYKEKLKAALR